MNYYYPYLESYYNFYQTIPAYFNPLYGQHLQQQWRQFYERQQKVQGGLPVDSSITWEHYQRLRERQRIFPTILWTPMIARAPAVTYVPYFF